MFLQTQEQDSFIFYRGLTAHPAKSEPMQRKLTSFKSNKVYENNPKKESSY
jgi:hypothetical protein